MNSEYAKMLQLFPCHGNVGRFNTKSQHRWVVDVWYVDGTKNEALFEVDSVEQAREIVSAHFGEVRESRYVSITDSYVGCDSSEANLIVTGSHTICKSCSLLREFLPERGV